MPKTTSLTALPGRLDKALVTLAPEHSRARLQGLIKAGHVSVNGKARKDPAHILKGGETLELTIPPTAPAKPRAQKIPLTVVYEDAHLLVIDKPAGLVVHPAAGHAEDTLVNALLAHCGKSLSGIGGEARPGIVHRLDKDTSGLMVVAKTDAAHRGLSEQFAAEGVNKKTLTRRYEALVWGTPKQKKGRIEGAIGRSPTNRKKMALTKRGGKNAVTHYEMLESFNLRAARLSCTLETGRTHQIRVHLASLGHGVIGDPLYGNAAGHKAQLRNSKNAEAILKFPRQALHAAELSFIHPVTKKTLRFQSPLPDDMQQLIKALRGG